MIFHESELTFNFDDKDWEVIQYDTHRYYKILSGVGLKGVDFLGIYQKEQVVFFEVKHFRSKHPTKDTTFSIFENPSKFIDRIKGKLNDTIRAIHVIIQYLERKGWYRFYVRFNHLIPTVLIKDKDWYFWHRLYQLVQQKEVLEFVIWLEVEEGLKTKVKEKLKAQLTTELESTLLEIVRKVKIADKKNLVFKESLVVK